ncbi:MAG: HAMP domain-containing sensor histidine kinase [Chloroflexia bacterium]
MSLRFRLTLWSTLLLGAFIAIFGVLSVFTVNYLLIQRVDENIDRQTTATLRYIIRIQDQNLAHVGDEDRIDSIFYTILDKKGNIVKYDRNIPIDADRVLRALDREVVVYDQKIHDGSRVRVMLKAITYNPTGEVVGVLQAATPLGFVDQILSEITMLLVISSVALLMIGAVGSSMLTGRAFRAVGAINSKVRQIELSQDLSQRVPEPSSGDELGNMARTFNGLLARLQGAFETQRRFVADSSHELRTPLTVIKSNLHLIRQTNDPAERDELLSITEGEVSRLNRMVNDLLYMAQMQAGHDLKPVLRPVELDSLLLDVFARARPLALHKHQRLSLVHEDIAATMGDRDQLQHLLLNLLDNAIKYTGEGGQVTLGLWNDKGWARIEVTDTGPGIASEELPHIFDRFFRTSAARQDQRNGSGLGLAIVKSITESHGGKVEVFSRFGEGTTFRLWLRLMDAPQAPDLEDEDDIQEAPQHALVAGE